MDDQSEASKKVYAEGEWKVTVIDHANPLQSFTNSPMLSSLANSSAYDKTVIISNKPETEWQHIFDGINKFHNAIDKNTLRFNYKKALNIVNNDPKLQLVKNYDGTLKYFFSDYDEAVGYATNFITNYFQMNVNTSEYNEIRNAIYGLGWGGYYYKLLFAVDNNNNVELTPFSLCCKGVAPANPFQIPPLPRLEVTTQGLKAIYRP